MPRLLAAGWVSAFADDGSMFQPGGLATGPAAVRAQMAPTFADTTFTLTWEPTRGEVAASGELRYTVGRWESRRRVVDGSDRVTRGGYLTVWRKQRDGTWKVLLDIGNPDG